MITSLPSSPAAEQHDAGRRGGQWGANAHHSASTSVGQAEQALRSAEAIELRFETESYWRRRESDAIMSGRDAYLCYTDGSCKAADGAPGGWGFVIKRPGLPVLEGYGRAQGTLAKVMEYRAVAEALAALPADANAVVFCDNQSLVENLSKQLANWARC